MRFTSRHEPHRTDSRIEASKELNVFDMLTNVALT